MVSNRAIRLAPDLLDDWESAFTSDWLMKHTGDVTPSWVMLPGRNDGKSTPGANPLIIVLDRSFKSQRDSRNRADLSF